MYFDVLLTVHRNIYVYIYISTQAEIYFDVSLTVHRNIYIYI